MDERLAGGPAAGGDDIAYEERVVAGRMLRCEPALDPRESAFEERRAELARPDVDASPQSDRRDAAGEVLRQVVLARAKDTDGEGAGLAHQLVQRCVPAEGDPQERRLERERQERVDGEPGRLASDVHCDDPDRRRELSEEVAELVTGHC
jgi:hypothetical protein